jgi:hypothetical protein
MTAIDDILAKYPDDEVSAALPVLYIAAIAVPVEQMPPALKNKVQQAMAVIGLNSVTNAEEVAVAIARYCVERKVNAAILAEIANHYQQGRTADILRNAASASSDEARKFVGADPVKTAPAEKVKSTAAPVKAKRGLKK